MKFNAHGPDGLINRKLPGQPTRLSGAHRSALKGIVESGQMLAIHGVVRWRLGDLCQWMWEDFRVAITNHSIRCAQTTTAPECGDRLSL